MRPVEPGAIAQELSVGRGAGLAFAVALLATLLMAAPVIMAPGEWIFGSGETLGREARGATAADRALASSL